MKRSDLSRFLNATVFRGLWIASAILIATISIAAELPSTRKAPVDSLTVMKPLPPPVVVFTGKALIVVPNGGSMSRYNLAVTNYQFYPPALFAQAPNLPPCGSNTNSARTWVEIYYRDQKQQPHRIYGFCALGSPQDLTRLWFALPEGGQKHPSPVYVVLNDRAMNKNYVSNPVDIYGPPSQIKPGNNP